jgi:heme oxygenase
MKEIELTQGYKTLVDDEDYEFLNQWKWCVRVQPCGRACAVRAERIKGTTNSKRNFQMHRVITNAQKGQIVDHINGNALDNRKENLRFCSKQENSMNRKTQSSSKFRSKYKGVSWDKARKKFIARVYFNNKAYVAGRFSTEEQAALAYNVLAKKLHGEYARFNVIEEG